MRTATITIDTWDAPYDWRRQLRALGIDVYGRTRFLADGRRRLYDRANVPDDLPSWITVEPDPIMSPEAAALKEFLLDLYEPDEALEWFFLPQPLLENRVPIDILTTDGPGPILRVFRRLDDGAYL